jgi:hypothetical protein
MRKLQQEVCLQSLDSADLWHLLASRRGGRDGEIHNALLEATFSAAERKWPTEICLQLCEDAAEAAYFNKKVFRTREAKEAYDREIKILSHLVRREKGEQR